MMGHENVPHSMNDYRLASKDLTSYFLKIIFYVASKHGWGWNKGLVQYKYISYGLYFLNTPQT